MSIRYSSSYWFLNDECDDPEFDKLPPDWAEQKAKEWVAEAPGCRRIVRSCGWAAEIYESFKNRPPRFRDFPGVIVVHCGDNSFNLALTLGVAACGEYVIEEFEPKEPE